MGLFHITEEGISYLTSPVVTLIYDTQTSELLLVVVTSNSSNKLKKHGVKGIDTLILSLQSNLVYLNHKNF